MTQNISSEKQTLDFSFGSIKHKSKKTIGNYELGKTLGSGSMGKVKLAVHLVTGQKFAVKIIPFEDPEQDNSKKDASRTKRIQREIALLKLLDHPYIVKLMDVVIKNGNYYLFFEHISGGQLLDYIISHGRLSENQARKFGRQMLSAIEYCHRNAVVHRDLKIENVLITDSGDIKVIDFGLSNLYSTKSQLDTFCGSLYFAAPELLNAKNYIGPEVDVWSLGVIFYVLVCGRVPFDDSNMPALHQKIKKGNVIYPNWISKDCKALLCKMLVTNPQERATINEIIKNTWINKGFNELIDIHFPKRSPLTLPLDTKIIENMDGFHFGSASDIETGLKEIIESDAYSQKGKNSLSSFTSNFPQYQNSQSSIHPNKIMDLRKFIFKSKKDSNEVVFPLVCIYYLVREKMEKYNIDSSSENLINGTENDNFGLIKNSSASDNNSEQAAPKTPTLKFGDDPNINKKHNRLSIRESLVKKFSREGLKNNQPKLNHRWSMVTTNKNETNNQQKNNTQKEEKMKRRWSKMGFSKKTNENASMSSSSEKEPNTSNTNSQAAVVSSQNSKMNIHQTINETDPIKASAQKEPLTSSKKPQTQNVKWKSMSLKGFFSTSTTSTKDPKIIQKDLFQVLEQIGIIYTVSDGIIECEIKNNDSQNNLNETENMDATIIKQLPPLKFHIQLVKIKLLKLYGVQFRRLEGGPWEYKSVCSLILSKLKL